MKRSPMPRKRGTKRKWKSPRCEVRGCTKPQDVKWSESVIHGPTNVGNSWTSITTTTHGLCRSHAKSEADRRFSLFIRQRDGKCQRCGAVDGLQCAHVVSRRYMNTRYREDNARALCLRCHKWETERQLEAEAWWEVVAPGKRAELREVALWDTERLDLGEVLAKYARWARLAGKSEKEADAA